MAMMDNAGKFPPSGERERESEVMMMAVLTTSGGGGTRSRGPPCAKHIHATRVRKSERW